MERVVADYERSGLTRRRFSERTGIAVSTLDYWRRSVGVRKARAVLPVSIAPEPVAVQAGGSAGFRVSLPNGVRIEGDWGFPEQGMEQLLRLAAER